MKKQAKKGGGSRGAISTVLLVLAVILIVVTIAVFVVIKVASSKKPATPATTDQTDTTQNEPPAPVYETTVGDVKFTFQLAQDLGNILSTTAAGGQNLTTTEKFIRVTIGAQNEGKTDLPRGSWSVGNIIDSDGRNFVSINNSAQAYYFLPHPDTCGGLLKPAFDPTPCVMLYEVAKGSNTLQVQVNSVSPDTQKRQSAYLDLLITK